MQLTGTTVDSYPKFHIQNFFCSVLFHLAPSPGMCYVLIYVRMDLLIHKYSFRMSHVIDLKNIIYCFFNLSQLGVIGSHCSYHNILKVMYF